MKHNVSFTIPKRELGRADIEFSVKKGRERFGTLKVSKGAIVWTPANKKQGYKVTWIQLSEFAQADGDPGHR